MAKRNKALRKISIVTVVTLALIGLALSVSTFAVITVSSNLSSSGSIVTSRGIAVFSDSACSVPQTTIDWGSATPGESVTRTVYVKNTGSGVSLTLNLAANGWSPTNANGPLVITWNKEGTVLAPGQSTAGTIMLTALSSITGISTFSVQISITGTG